MTVRIFSLIFIYLSASAAWAILGGSVWHRTNDVSASLGKSVASIWGRPQVQIAPSACYRPPEPEQRRENLKPAAKANKTPAAPPPSRATSIPLPISQTRVNADLRLEPRRKGLLWYSTYTVGFQGVYRFENKGGAPRDVLIRFRLPEGQAVCDAFSARINDKEVGEKVVNSVLEVWRSVPAGESIDLRVSYRSQGLDSWTYSFGPGVSRVNDFALTIRTNFDRIDFPDNGLAPSNRVRAGDGWDLRWNYASLLSGLNIVMAMPAKLQPGELVSRITFFAPVSLMFFFFLMFILTLLKNIEMHPMNYFFLAASFFAFHLLLAYTADLIDIHLAFLISAGVSIFLVVSYLRLVVNARFAFLEAGLLQFLYLVGFSYTFFLEGYSALCVTVVSIMTLYIVMRLTAKIRWTELFETSRRARPAPPPANTVQSPLKC